MAEKENSYKKLKQLAHEVGIELSEDEEIERLPRRRQKWYRRLKYWWAHVNPLNWR